MRSALKKVAYWPPVVRLSRALGLQAVLRRAYYKVSRPTHGTLTLRLDGGPVSFQVPTPESLRGVEAVLYGERRIWEYLRAFLRPGDVFFDVGSSLGAYAVLLGHTVGPQGLVVAFEPDAESLLLLEQNIALNTLGNVKVFSVALGAVNGTAELHRGDHHAASSLLPTGRGRTTSRSVPVFRGDDLVQQEHLPVPRAVKIDVQGFEYAVLQGLERTLSADQCRLVCCEVHPTLLPEGLTAEDVYRLLRSFGFTSIEVQARADDLHAICYKPRAGA